MDLSRDRLVKSSVVDSKTGKSIPSDVRTSSGTFLAKQQDHIIAEVEKRVAQLTMIPEENQEAMQVLRYVDGEKYEPHHDYFHDPVNATPDRGGQRVATVLMYLTTVGKGGETVFPQADHKVEGPQWSDCAKEGLSVRPVQGDAVMFFSLHPNGHPDPTSLHGSCPTLEGEKWSATKWIHVSSFGISEKEMLAKWKGQGGCSNTYDDLACVRWAQEGECESNPIFMKRQCRKACKLC